MRLCNQMDFGMHLEELVKVTSLAKGCGDSAPPARGGKFVGVGQGASGLYSGQERLGSKEKP